VISILLGFGTAFWGNFLPFGRVWTKLAIGHSVPNMNENHVK
jgi:hypothetical protein